MTVRKMGWIARLLGERYNMTTQFGIRSNFSVIACNNEEWPVTITTGGGEFHVLRLLRNTVILMIDFISRAFCSDDDDSEITPDVTHLLNSDEIEFGDRIVVWRTKRGWSLAKKGVGMPSAELSDSEWRHTRTALEKALQDSQESTAISDDMAN